MDSFNASILFETPPKDLKPFTQERNELLKTVKRLGTRLWKKWSGYHQRCLVKAKMLCIKHLGEKLMARKFGGVSKSMLTLNETIIDVKKG